MESDRRSFFFFFFLFLFSRKVDENGVENSQWIVWRKFRRGGEGTMIGSRKFPSFAGREVSASCPLSRFCS